MIAVWLPQYLGLPQTGPVPTPQPDPIPEPPHETIRRGSWGHAVIVWQRTLGIKADGSFGPITDFETRRWQKEHSLTADGIVGPKTWAVAMREQADTDPAPPPECPS
jgi:peptidoglycan hydrolase-like protein with peptidoglycan-binding domain